MEAILKQVLLHLPVYLALLAGAVICLVAWLQGRRRPATMLGAIGFLVVFLVTMGSNFIPNLMNWLQSRGIPRSQLTNIYNNIIPIVLSAIDAIAFGLLAAGVLLRERPVEETAPEEEV